jgi:hypothetical protein
MAGKSIDDILRQQAAQRQAAMQAQQAQERALNEQRERSRQEYLHRVRMFEASNNVSNAVAAASSAAGGRPTSSPVVTQANSDESILYYNFVDGVFTYFIYNFEADILTDIKTINLSNSPDIRPVTKGGFFLQSSNNDNSNYELFFIGLNGEVTWQDTTDNTGDVDIENFSRYIAAYYLKGVIWKLVVFDKDGNIKSFEFQNPIEGGGYSYDDVWNGGFVVREDISNIQKFYIINFEAGTSTQFHEIDTETESLNIYLYAFSNKILSVKNGNLFEVFNSNGQKISEFDVLDEFDVANYSYNDFTFLNDNGSFVLFGSIGDTRNIIFFSGVSNQFSYKRVNTNDYEDYAYDVYSQKSYTNPRDYISEGSAIFMFYNNGNEIGGIEYYDSSIILPVFSTDSQLRDFYELTSEKGIVTDNLDDNDVSITRNADHINLLIDGNGGLLYYFSDAGSGSPSGGDISEGGNDMYDNGNYLYADDVQIEYTHTQLLDYKDGGMLLSDFISDGVVFSGPSASVFGASSSADYFTNLYPGLFVLAAQNTEIDEFRIDGGLGADGGGSQSTLIFEREYESKTWGVFVKRVWGANIEGEKDPSVNHIIIVNGGTSSITQTISESTNDDLHKLEGLASAGVNEIYHLLIALKNGSKLEDDKVEGIVSQFLSILDSSSDINELLTNLNSYYENITGVLPLPDENYSILRFNREGDSNTIIPTNITKIGLEDDDQINGKTILQFERIFEENGTWGWNNLSDLEDRFLYSFQEAQGSNIDQELILKDTVSNKYWGIKFTEWENEGGGFAYTRQLISGGTFSGEIISFTFSDWSDVADIIEPGVLEIKRDYYGPIYNSAVESESNGRNPKGTLWNSEYVYGELSEYDHYIVNNEGQVVDKVTTASDYDNHYEGATYILEDEIFHKTWVSNNQNDKEFQLLPNYYHNYEECNNTSNESGLRLGNFIISDGFKNRIVTEDSISEEFITPSTGIISKSGDREVFYNGGCVITSDESNTIFYFYNISGELVGQKSVSEAFIEYSQDERGNRFSIRYLVDGKTNVILFNGTTIREFETNLGEMDISINDYSWWD